MEQDRETGARLSAKECFEAAARAADAADPGGDNMEARAFARAQFWRDEALRARVEEVRFRERVAELEKLAYMGEHRFPDQTWKARCEEERAQCDSLREENERLRADNAGLLNEAERMLPAYHESACARAEICECRARSVMDVLHADHPGADLLKHLREQGETIRALLALVKERVDHLPTCATRKPIRERDACDCGIWAAISKAEAWRLP